MPIMKTSSEFQIDSQIKMESSAPVISSSSTPNEMTSDQLGRITSDNFSDYYINSTHLSDNLTLLSPQEWLDHNRDSLFIVIPITVIYVAIFVTGVVGNISTCIVIRKNRSMHTATNYYLFSLAISDFLLLLSGVPQEIYYVWFKYTYVFGEAFCIGRGFVAETSANATVLTITAFTAERYVAICHPFMAHAMSKLNRATRIILFIWFASFLTAIPQAAQFGVANHNGIEQCTVLRVVIEHSFQLSTFIFFFTPMSIIFILYLLIGLKLYQTNLVRSSNGNIVQRVKGTNSLQSQSSHGTRRVLKMLVAVVIAFFICWAPFHAQRLIYVYGTNPKDPLVIQLYTIMTYISGVLYYLSTCINPLLYNIMSNKFRQAFKETLDQWKMCSSKTDEPKRKYNVLPRPKRLRVTFQESTDYTSSSQREESFQSTSSFKCDTMTFTNQRCLIHQEKFMLSSMPTDSINRSSRLMHSHLNLETCMQHCNGCSLLSSSHECPHNAIVKIDEIDLPSRDASLNVLYTKEGDIQIRLQRKPSTKRRQRFYRRFFSSFTRILKSRPSPTHMGFYTPPIDDNLSLYSLNVSNRLTPGKDTKECYDNISNSSLKDFDPLALASELSGYIADCSTSNNDN